MEVKQFKLTNNDEIICEVIDWTDDADVLVQNAYRIINVEDTTHGVNYYYFRPFMIFQEQAPQRINSAHIIAEADPTDEMISHFDGAKKDAAEKVTERNMRNAEEQIDDIVELLEQMEEQMRTGEGGKKIIH